MCNKIISLNKCNRTNHVLHFSDKIGWMRRLRNHLKLNEISIPGTHDTMAISGESGSTAMSQSRLVLTQDMSLYNQLLAGIRFLDIRLSPHHTKGFLQINHNVVNLQTNFEAVLTTCLHFLDFHPTETIIVKTKCEPVYACVREYHKLFYKAIKNVFPTLLLRHGRLYGYDQTWENFEGFEVSREIPKLEDARGKIVFFNENKKNTMKFPGLLKWRIPLGKTHVNFYDTSFAWDKRCKEAKNQGQDYCNDEGVKKSYIETIHGNIVNASSNYYPDLFYKTQVSAVAVRRGPESNKCWGTIRHLSW